MERNGFLYERMESDAMEERMMEENKIHCIVGNNFLVFAYKKMEE